MAIETAEETAAGALPPWLDPDTEGAPPEALRMIYEKLPSEVTQMCERARSAMREGFVRNLVAVRDALAPYGLFKQWCGAAGIPYRTAQDILYRDKRERERKERQKRRELEIELTPEDEQQDDEDEKDEGEQAGGTGSQFGPLGSEESDGSEPGDDDEDAAEGDQGEKEEVTDNDGDEDDEEQEQGEGDKSKGDKPPKPDPKPDPKPKKPRLIIEFDTDDEQKQGSATLLRVVGARKVSRGAAYLFMCKVFNEVWATMAAEGGDAA